MTIRVRLSSVGERHGSLRSRVLLGPRAELGEDIIGGGETGLGRSVGGEMLLVGPVESRAVESIEHVAAISPRGDPE